MSVDAAAYQTTRSSTFTFPPSNPSNIIAICFGIKTQLIWPGDMDKKEEFRFY
jgi:lambda repressor-like predicted transcriptional regulator